MITARPQKNLQTAKAYFRKHLAKDDYHSEGQTVAGWWFGQGAMRLGLDLAAPVTQAAYERLCDNLHPLTGEKLTVRHRQADRRVCYDFVISAPKSVSIMAHTVGDERILIAHAEAAVAAMRRMEQTAATRVRRGGRQEARSTGEIVAAVSRIIPRRMRLPSFCAGPQNSADSRFPQAGRLGEVSALRRRSPGPHPSSTRCRRCETPKPTGKILARVARSLGRAIRSGRASPPCSGLSWPRFSDRFPFAHLIPRPPRRGLLGGFSGPL